MDWVRGDRLGHGSFATVDLAVPGRRSAFLPPLMAVKSCGASCSSFLVHEKAVLEELKDCPEIIRCFGDSVSCENGERLYNVLLEYASGGSLAGKVEHCGGRGLPETEVRRCTKALLKGLNYIHKFGYVHCDIKLQNILLDSDGGVKIADFGLAKRAGGKFACGELRGTPMYMAPEMVAGGEQGAAADVWAMGCVVSEMVKGSPAWRCSDAAALLMRIGVGEEVPEIPGMLSDDGKDFLGKCFVKDPSKRWTAEMLLRHPFVCGQGFDDDDCTETSTSPRCPFDFPDWVSCSITSLPSPGYLQESGSWFSDEPNLVIASQSSVSPGERLRGLVSERGLDWSVSDDWVTVR